MINTKKNYSCQIGLQETISPCEKKWLTLKRIVSDRFTGNHLTVWKEMINTKKNYSCQIGLQETISLCEKKW